MLSGLRLGRTRMRATLVVGSMAIFAVFAHAETCLVVGVSDGDTLKARCGNAGAYRQVKIRLAEIDAPEKKQPFGEKSKEALSGLCYMAVADIDPVSVDRYRRTIARVRCRGKDAGSEQVRLGMAWAFTRYLRDPNIAALQETARQNRRGLWVDYAPIAPWEWRAQRRRAAPSR